MTAAAARDSLPKLEKYELIEEIGHGGMATVYRALDVRLGREVAVKIIHRHLRENVEVATRFVAEARAAAKLKHRGIVEVYDVSDEDDRERFLVVELVRGCTLRKILTDHRDMPVEIGACIALELCDAIEHAHAFGIVHRDIKPENVLVELPKDRVQQSIRSSEVGPTSSPKSGSGNGSATPVSGGASGHGDGHSETPARSSGPGSSGPADVAGSLVPSSGSPRSGRRKDEVLIKITDFGIAKILDAQGVTSTGQVLGSPAHMAPEQIEGGDVDVRTDVFALGVLMYECMVGHLPFEGKNPAQVLRRVIEGSYERAETERPTVGGRFSRILDGALANDPKDRVENPAALAALIKEELEALGIEDSRREVALYFADPDAYRQQLVQRLVPRLVARGEEARKHKRIQDAGWDFNRAHALAPDDVAILRRMTQLGGSADRQKLMRRVGMVAAASIGLGTIAFFTARAYRDRDVELAPSDDIGPDATQADPRLEMLPPRMRARMNEAIASSATGSARVRTPIPRSSAGGSAGPAPDVSNKDPVSITFFVKPRGAQLEVDGAVIDHMTKQLIAPGSHTARLIPPKGGCCEPGQVSRSFEVKPQVGDGTDKPQSLSISAQFRPAKVRLSGPSGGKAFCGPHTLAVGQTESITMTDASWAGQCKFIGGEGDPRSGFGEFFAGVTTELSWPPPEKAPSP